MAETTVVADLQALLNLEPNEGETQTAFAKRLAEKGFAVTEEEWETLGEPTQRWVNDTVTAISEKKPISQLTLPSGIETVIAASAESEEGEAEEAPPPAKKPAKKKASTKLVGAADHDAAMKVASKKAKPAKAAKSTKPAKKAAKTNGAPKAKTGPKGRFGLEDKIKVLKKENPFRAGTKCYAWFAKYKDGMTVEAAVEAGIPRHHIRWDMTLGNTKIG